jgi:hypothetical protein
VEKPVESVENPCEQVFGYGYELHYVNQLFTVGEGLDPPLGKQSLPVDTLASKRFAKGGSRPSPTVKAHGIL